MSQKRNIKFKITGFRSFLFIAALSVTAVSSDMFINNFFLDRYLNIQKERVYLELSNSRIKIEETLNKNLYIIYGMASYISVNNGIISREVFNRMARMLLSNSDSLKNIAVAPDFIITHIYPMEENRKALGLNYRNIPEQWKEANEARVKKSMVIAGPIKLVQGGTGLAARIPVFINNGRTFWGLVSAVIDFDTIVENSGIKSSDSYIDILIEKETGANNLLKNKIMGNPELSGSSSLISMPLNLPHTKWIISARPRAGWLTQSPSRWLLHSLITIIYISILFIWIQRHKANISLFESESRLRAMSRSSHDALIMIDSNDIIGFWNTAAEQMFGYSEAETLGRKMHEIISTPEDREKAEEGLRHFKSTGQGPIVNSVREVNSVRKSGEIFPSELSVSSFQIKNSWYAVGSIRDISARKEAEEKLITLATTDSLTGILNRRKFMESCSLEAERSKRYGHRMSFIMFDIDHFKIVNDNFGHDAGDKVLKEISAYISAMLRKTDLFARVGGEEFAVLLPETGIETAQKLAERLREGVSQRKIPGYDRIKITSSFGVTEMHPHGENISDIMKRSDRALYTAKNTGRNRVSTENWS